MILWNAIILLIQFESCFCFLTHAPSGDETIKNVIHEQINLVKDQFLHLFIDSQKIPIYKTESFENLWQHLEISLAAFEPKLPPMRAEMSISQRLSLARSLQKNWMDHVKSTGKEWIVKSLRPWIHESRLSANHIGKWIKSVEKLSMFLIKSQKGYAAWLC